MRDMKVRRRWLFNNQLGKCVYCHDEMILNGTSRKHRRSKKLATIEHIIPRSDNGTNSSDNTLCSCKDCNSRRGSINHDTFMFLRQFSNWKELAKIEIWKLEHIYVSQLRKSNQFNDRLAEFIRFDIKIRQPFIYV